LTATAQPADVDCLASTATTDRWRSPPSFDFCVPASSFRIADRSVSLRGEDCAIRPF